MTGNLTQNQVELREQLVFRRAYDPKYYGMGGIAYFDQMSVETAKELLRNGLIDPDDAQNLSPTAQEMIDFCDDGTGKWYLHGYVVSPDRPDCRISFVGCGSTTDLTAEEAFWFLKTFLNADTIDCAPGCTAYCWFD